MFERRRKNYDIEDVLSDHYQKLDQLIGKYDGNMGRIAVKHDGACKNWQNLQEQEESSLSAILYDTSNESSVTANVTATEVSAQLQIANSEILGNLSQEDYQVYDQAKGLIGRKFGGGTSWYEIDNVIGQASSSTAKNTISTAMLRYKEKAQEEESSRNEKYRDPFSSYDHYFDPEDFMRNFMGGDRFNFRDFAGQGRGQAPPRPRQTPKESAPKYTPEQQQARTIIETVVSKFREAVWLKGADINDVVRVIAKVRELRADAKKNNEEISDKQIYIHFRRPLDNHEAEGYKQLEEEFKILNALMGNKPTGKLEF